MKSIINQRQKIELADILKSSKQALEREDRLCSTQKKSLEALIRCRTREAGGHVSLCNKCGHKEQSYNSCRDRHCPKCQFIKQEQWVDKLKSRLIPGRYFHVVFTIPHQLNTLFYINQRECYKVLFSSAWEALKQAGNNSGFLGAEVGAVAVLHTWGQTLSYHPHIHMMVPAGGLSEDGMEWIEALRKFFVPVKALSSMFRGIMIRELKAMIAGNKLKLPDHFRGFDAMKKELYDKNWNVYCKKAFGGINGLLQYLGRYIHSVAISNRRLIGISGTKICFRYRDYRQEQRRHQNKIMELELLEFARRFLQHILPLGFYKIRYFGILSTANIATKREQSITLIGKTLWLSHLEGLNSYETLRSLMDRDPAICPVCRQGIMQRQRELVQLE